MLKEFRTFVLRGNVVDLAVGLVIGAAFGAVVTSLVADVITPIITIPGDIPNFGELTWTISGSVIRYGDFLNTVIALLTIAAAVFFFVVKPVNAMMERFKTEPEVQQPTKQCTECLSNIPMGAKRCAFCTSPQSSNLNP